MSSIKVVLRRKPNQQGLYPLVVRITKNRKSTYISTGKYLEEKYWDKSRGRIKKSHPNSTRLNHFLTKKLAEITDKILEAESENNISSAQSIGERIRSKKEHFSFFDLATNHLQHLEDSRQFNRLSIERSRVNHFRDFLKQKDLHFQEITPVLLRKYQAYLRKVKNNGDSSVASCLIVIRTIYNLAIREGMVDRRFYPFGKGGIVIKFPESTKVGLSNEELEQFESIELTDPREIHARNVWLFSFYFAGIRHADVLQIRWSDIREGRLYYQMDKNNKTTSLKVPTKAAEILSQYEQDRLSDSDFIFPEMKKADLSDPKDVNRKIKNGNKVINNEMC
ncbi:MAG: site-specific integrase [Bacteroidota bacterium]